MNTRNNLVEEWSTGKPTLWRNCLAQSYELRGHLSKHQLNAVFTTAPNGPKGPAHAAWEEPSRISPKQVAWPFTWPFPVPGRHSKPDPNSTLALLGCVVWCVLTGLTWLRAPFWESRVETFGRQVASHKAFLQQPSEESELAAWIIIAHHGNYYYLLSCFHLCFPNVACMASCSHKVAELHGSSLAPHPCSTNSWTAGSEGLGCLLSEHSTMFRRA